MLMSFFFFKQKTAYEMRISDWSSDVCSSDLVGGDGVEIHGAHRAPQLQRHAMGRALAHRLGIDVGDTPEIPNAAGGHLAIERTVKFSVAIGQVCFKVRTGSPEHGNTRSIFLASAQ